LNPDFPIPVSFFYGDRDWTDHKAGQAVVQINKFARSLSHVYYISDSDHHMYIDNPIEFATLIIDDIEGKWAGDLIHGEDRQEEF